MQGFGQKKVKKAEKGQKTGPKSALFGHPELVEGSFVEVSKGLAKRVKQLQRLTKKICKAKIESFVT